MQKSFLNRYDLICAFLLVVACYITFNGFLTSDTFFQGDDFPWLYQAKFGRFVPTLGLGDTTFHDKYGNLEFFYQLIPTSIYNDRLIGYLWLKFSYLVFGLNSQFYYIAQFLLHIGNVLLFYSYCKKIGLDRLVSLTTCVLVACWFVCVEAVFRINCIFDVLGMTFVLLTILSFITYQKNSSKSYLILSLLFLFLGVRTKEYTLSVVPIIFFQCLLLDNKKIYAALKATKYHILLSLIILSRYTFLYFDNSTNSLIGEQTLYSPRFEIQTIVINLYSYLNRSFYLNEIGSFASYTLLSLSFLLFVISIKDNSTKIKIFCSISFVLLLGPVLFFKSQQNNTYLYAPHFFLSLFICTSLLRGLFSTILTFVIVFGLIFLPYVTHSVQDIVNWYQIGRNENRNQIYDFDNILTKNMMNRSEKISIFVKGVKPELNVFAYGWALRTFFDFKEPELVKAGGDEGRLSTYVLGERNATDIHQFLYKMCHLDGDKIYIDYDKSIIDQTGSIKSNCSSLGLILPPDK